MLFKRECLLKKKKLKRGKTEVPFSRPGEYVKNDIFGHGIGKFGNLMIMINV